MTAQRFTIGFSIHRPEIIGMTAELMQDHEAIFLEEPPQSGFDRMLAGDLSVEDYLMRVDVEYPAFSRQMCRLMRKLDAAGKKIIQVEPFLEHLLSVHERFAEGHSPDEIPLDSIAYQVYSAEKDATKALLDYYQIVMDGTFEEAIEAVKRFARADAARFRLRDTLRAGALVDRLAEFSCAYIEAGSIHYGLYVQLRHRLRKQVYLKPVFLAHQALHHMGRRGHLYGPGDQLTLSYIFHPKQKDGQRDALLAARSLVYTKLLEKEEQTAKLETFPHIRDELACIQMVQQLTLEDCKRLFPLICRSKSANVRPVVKDYLARFKKNFQPPKNDLSSWPDAGENNDKMKPIPFDPQKDRAPMVFDTKTCQLAQEMKRLGIDWRPHVGCFVWDPYNTIAVESPFPHRIYFILSLHRFIDIFGSREAIAEKLVWLPTWHQARLLCQQLNVPDEAIAQIWHRRPSLSAGDELKKIYEHIIVALQNR